MTTKERKILVLDFLRQGAPIEKRLEYGGILFDVVEHSIGWDFETAEALIKKHDGYVDGIALSGLRTNVSMGQTRVIHGPSMKLLRAAKRSQIYLGDDIRGLFADWTLKRVLKTHPNLFRGKRALLHCAVATPFYETFQAAGARLEAADSLVIAGLPVLLKGTWAMEQFLKGMKVAQLAMGTARLDPQKKFESPETLQKWIKQTDVFITYGGLLDQVDDYSTLADKIVVVDFLSADQRKALEAAKPALILEFVPSHKSLEDLRPTPLPLLTAVVDQMRLAEDSPLGFNDYTLNWIAKLNLQPNKVRRAKETAPRRCGFIIHPLGQRDLWRVPGINRLKDSPKPVRNFIESSIAKFPIVPYGTLTGAVSDSTGQEVVCDLYGILATPRQLLSMDEEFLYKRLVRASEMAAKKGSLLFGLGAYTKVAGDAGVTVAKRATIPVTTGNSYSVATTLWAARVMVEKLGLTPGLQGTKKIAGKAMVIGATGSIGRVASLLVSLIYDEIVLVGTRPDKLLELREEMRQYAPDGKVRMTTNANSELRDTSLIVTATSNQSGSILDIQAVRPGTVICDCSRPLDISAEEAKSRPDVLVIESGEVDLPGNPFLSVDIGLPKPSVYACLAETVLLTMEGRYEQFTLGRDISMDRVKEIYKIGLKHGARLSAIRGHEGVVTDERITQCRNLALERLKTWPGVDMERMKADLRSIASLSDGAARDFL